MQNSCKEIKAVFMDCDFTLYSHNSKCFPQSAIEAVRKASERGIICVMATGRSIAELSLFKQLDELKLHGMILMNGLLGLDCKGNVIFENPFEGEVLDNIIHHFRNNTRSMLLIEKDRNYFNFADPEISTKIGNLAVNRFEKGDWNGNKVYMIVTFCSAEEEAEVMSYFPGCSAQRWSDFGIDIVPEGSDKSVGIVDYLDKLGIDLSECMCIGDAPNDIGMIKAAGIGVAMGNASQAVKDVADYVTTDIDDDGILNAFTHFGLI